MLTSALSPLSVLSASSSRLCHPSYIFRSALRRLKTAQHRNCIEEISILIDHSRKFKNLTPSESDIFPWEEFALLLTANFPRLHKIQFLLQTDDLISEVTPIL